MANTDLRTSELMFEVRKDSIKEHLDMLIQKTERQVEELKLMRKRMNSKEYDLVGTLERATEYIENVNWHLARGINLTNDLLIAKMRLEDEQNKMSSGNV